MLFSKLDICSGEIVSILGPSGIGKTTLLRIIAGFESRFQGNVTYNGKPKVTPNRDIQLMFQDYCLLPWKNVIDNVLFSQDTAKLPQTNEIAQKLLSDVGLKGKDKYWPRQLSGGEIARVALARAVNGNPGVLLLDEPFANVDSEVKSDLQELLVKLAKTVGICVILVTHIIEDAVMVSDRIVITSSRPMGEFISHTIDEIHPRSIRNKMVQQHILNIQSDVLTKRSTI